jgi:hypothetical protein
MSLDNLLVQMAKDNDLIFTYEEVRDMSHRGSLQASLVTSNVRKADVKATLDDLVRVVPHFAYRVDKHSPKVFHIIDDRLVHQKGYVFNDVITLNYEGTPRGLLAAIAKKGIPLSPELVFDSTEFSFTDMGAQVHSKVKAKNLTVRQIVSDFVLPSRHASGVLWIAETDLGPNKTGYIRFRRLGP